ncbi:MAG: hypothetical protein IIA83_02180 [Thaumarchaeota archaeon]|nr:hypothetical protein [Nitrososphaerota archaeon]
MEQSKGLPKDLEQNCHRLDVKEQEFSKWNKPATGLGFLAVFSLLAFLVYLPSELELENFSTETYISGGLIFVSVSIGYYCYRKSNKYGISGFELNTVRAYRAYNMLEKYKTDNLDVQLEKSEDIVYSLLSDLQSGWGNFSEKNPSFKSLAKPIDEFLKNLEYRLIPAFADKKSDNISNIQKTLSSLVMFFQSDSFGDIDRVNQELKQYKDTLTERETVSEKIKKNKHFITILLTLAIIGGGWALSESTKFLKEDIQLETQLILWVAISVPFTVWLLHSRYKK